MSVLQLSPLMPLRYRHGFHSRLEDLNRLLRYSLGGIRPKQTAHQVLFPSVLAGQVRIYILKEWYFTDDSIPPESGTSKSPTYATHPKHIPNTKLQ